MKANLHESESRKTEVILYKIFPTSIPQLKAAIAIRTIIEIHFLKEKIP
jgi:hypothetical protein